LLVDHGSPTGKPEGVFFAVGDGLALLLQAIVNDQAGAGQDGGDNEKRKSGSQA